MGALLRLRAQKEPECRDHSVTVQFSAALAGRVSLSAFLSEAQTTEERLAGEGRHHGS
jgi:hypothetical protein